MRLIALFIAQYSCSRYMASNVQINIYCRELGKWVKFVSEKKTSEINRTIGRPPPDDCRWNEMGIQMLSAPLYEQVFRNTVPRTMKIDAINKCQEALRSLPIKISRTPKLADVNVKLPPFRGENLLEHFHEIANEQSQPYRHLVESMVRNDIPPMPKTWKMIEGWTRYNDDGSTTSVPYPEENALIFNSKVCMSEGEAPTMASAVGARCWYSWTCNSLLSETKQSHRKRSDTEMIHVYSATDMIPMESDASNEHKLIIGHNVSYDRARIRNQYNLQMTPTRFLDTMALHVCVSGNTSSQRAMLKSSKRTGHKGNSPWMSQTSLYNLAAVFKLYCDSSSGDVINEKTNSVFIDGTLDDVRCDFQHLMEYCAKEVRSTYRVLQDLYPLFVQRFPHPATFAGMLESGMPYLPVNSSWLRYINASDLAYTEFGIELKSLLEKRANQACRLLHGDAYKSNLWLWDQDWSVEEFKKNKMPRRNEKAETTSYEKVEPISDDEEIEYQRLQRKFRHLFDTTKVRKRRQLLVGYPAWYRKLCMKSSEQDWQPGPKRIGLYSNILPKLLSLCWEGYPLHYIPKHGWGFLVPITEQTHQETRLPLQQLVKKCPLLQNRHSGRHHYYAKGKTNRTNRKYTGTGVWCDVELEGCCWFLQLPESKRPLAASFLSKFSENLLTGDDAISKRLIQIARMSCYWQHARSRILSQIVVAEPNQSENGTDGVLSVNGSAAIIPQVLTCGTVSRRVTDSTWSASSNPNTERIGSEIRPMAQAPDGYRIVGADVDLQELWILSVLGDASEAGVHGGTPFGWITLNGTKSNATDFHSITANANGITRQNAKNLNYGQIYGMAEVNFNGAPLLSKGEKLYSIRDEYVNDFRQLRYRRNDALKVCARHGKRLDEMFTQGEWNGGILSAAFNYLDKITRMQPRTPFLDCRLSRAIEAQQDVEDQIPLNLSVWAVQSGAVDFLHLMLVCMRWLMGDNIRFCISLHDEVRYLVREDLAYKAAVALHMTNLLTRSFCAMRIGLNDLPQSVAFFSSVEVDRVYRKESQMECNTPSNPHGLKAGYGIPFGETLDVQQSIEKANGNDLNEWEWHSPKKC